MVNLMKYIGRPYEEYDCLDLVREFYADYFGVEIKHFYDKDRPSKKETEKLLSTNLGDFKRIEPSERRLGDLMVINLFGVDCHLGIVIGVETFMHSSKDIGSHIARIKRYENLISGYYRYDQTKN